MISDNRRDESRSRSRIRKKIISRRSRTMDDLLFGWSDREKKAALEMMENANDPTLATIGTKIGLSGILSPRDKKSTPDGNTKPNAMSSPERVAPNREGSPTDQQSRARYQYQYEQRPLYNDNSRRSRSVERYGDPSEYYQDDYRRVAQNGSSSYKYEGYSKREVQREVQREVDHEQRSVRYHQGGTPQSYNAHYDHEKGPRDKRVTNMQQDQEKYQPSPDHRYHTSRPYIDQYQQGPPKPPRRQQSLNRIHIPSGPDCNEDSKSPSDVEFSSTSPESPASPKHWNMSPLVQSQRGFAVVGSPTKLQQEPVYPGQQLKQSSPSKALSRNQNDRGPSQDVTHFKQQGYPHERNKPRPSPTHNHTSSLPRQSNIMRQETLPESHSLSRNAARNREVQRSASLGRKSDRNEAKPYSDMPTKSHVTASHTAPKYNIRDSNTRSSPVRPGDSKGRPVSKDRQVIRSRGKTIPAERNQPKYRPEGSRHRKVSPPERNAVVPTRVEKHSYDSPVNSERVISPDKQTAMYSSPHYLTQPISPTSPVGKSKTGGLGALLKSDKDHNPVTSDSVPWLPDSGNRFCRPDYISDSGISSLRDVPAKPQSKHYVSSPTSVPDYDYDYPIKQQAALQEDTAQFRLYGDGPFEYPLYDDREMTKLIKQQQSEDHPSRAYTISPPYSPTASGKTREEPPPPRQRNYSREYQRSSSQEISDPELKNIQREPQRPYDVDRISSSYRGALQHQKTSLESSTRKSLFESGTPDKHYDYAVKLYPSDEDPPKPTSYSTSNYSTRQLAAQVQCIKVPSTKYPETGAEVDHTGFEPAVDGGEAYWGMESRNRSPQRIQQHRPPDPALEYHSMPGSTKDRNEMPTHITRKDRPPQSQIQRQEASLNQTAPPPERQSRYDRLKQRAAGQSDFLDSQRRSKSLTRLDNPSESLKSSELSGKKSSTSKSTDDLEELRRTGVSRGAALFLRMMQQATIEDDEELNFHPSALDSYVGTPKLFQPQLTKTGEPILEMNWSVTSPDLEMRGASSYDSLDGNPFPNIEPVHQPAKVSKFDPIPSKVQTERKSASTQQNREVEVDPKLIGSPDQSTLATTRRHGNQEVPVEWLTKQQQLKRTPSVEKRSPSPTKLKSPSSPEHIPLARRGKQDVPVEWLNVLDRVQYKPKGHSSGSSLSSPTKSPTKERSHRVSADFEDALSELERMYLILDEEADDLMHGKSYKPFEQRIAKLPPALQKRLRDLKEYAQGNTQRVHRERTRSDLALRTQPPVTKPSHVVERSRKPEFSANRQSTSGATKLTKPTTLDLPLKMNDQQPWARLTRKEQRSSDDEDHSSKQRNASQLYRQPKSTENLGYSSDSSPSPKQARRINLTQFELQEPQIKPNVTTGTKSSDKSESLRGAVIPEYKPSPQRQPHSAPNDTQHTETKQLAKSAPRTVQEVVTKTTVAAVTACRDLLAKLDPGSRSSVDSACTVDSLQLSQAFEEMTAEYHKICTDHRLECASSDEDVNPGRHSSSTESLVRSVSTSGSELLKRRSKLPAGNKPSDVGAGKTASKAQPGPVPLATFDEGMDNRPGAFADILHLLSWIDSTDI